MDRVTEKGKTDRNIALMEILKINKLMEADWGMHSILTSVVNINSSHDCQRS